MNSVYDVIDILRTWRNFTMKELADRASISYTTLASIMKRRPEKIALNTLERIGWAFGLEWYKLLGRESEYRPKEAYRGRNVNGERISATMDEPMIRSVLQNIIGEDYEKVIEWTEAGKKVLIRTSEDFERIKRRDLRGQFNMCVDLVFDNLSEAGVVEAMRYILELSQNPKYCKSTDLNTNKEDIE